MKLSPAMRTVLHAAIHGGLSTAQLGSHATRQSVDALQARGLLDAQCKATPAGRAVYYPNPARPCQVWHLAGPQGSGKGLWARAEVRTLAAKGLTACHMDVHTFETVYAANPARIVDELGHIDVLMLESNWTGATSMQRRPGRPALHPKPTGTSKHPPHHMAGDRVLRFPNAAAQALIDELRATSEQEARRPGITALCEQLRAWYPQWSDARLRTEAKAMWQLVPDEEAALKRLLAAYTRQKGQHPRRAHGALVESAFAILQAEERTC